MIAQLFLIHFSMNGFLEKIFQLLVIDMRKTTVRTHFCVLFRVTGKKAIFTCKLGLSISYGVGVFMKQCGFHGMLTRLPKHLAKQ
jgi:hypothetical protein